MVAVALPRELLNEIYRLYTTFAEISETQRRLQVARDSDTAAFGAAPDTFAARGGFPAVKVAMTDYFGTAANDLIPNLSARVEAVLTRGNPIPLE